MAEFKSAANKENSENTTDIHAALAGLDNITKADVTELKSLITPPCIVRHVLTMVNVLISGKPKPADWS